MSLYYWSQVKPVLDYKWTPYGSYKWRRQRESYSETETIYKDFFKEAEEMQDNWLPIKQGLFDNSFEKYLKIKGEVDLYLKNIHL